MLNKNWRNKQQLKRSIKDTDKSIMESFTEKRQNVEEFLKDVENNEIRDKSMILNNSLTKDVFDTLSDVSSDDSDIKITHITDAKTQSSESSEDDKKGYIDTLDYLKKPPICIIKQFKNYLVLNNKQNEENVLTNSSSSENSDNQEEIILDNSVRFNADGSIATTSLTNEKLCKSQTEKDGTAKNKRKRKSQKRFPNNPELKNEQRMFKYWSQRYDLFERFDMGIKLDRESWFSVTPESIAKVHAQLCQTTDTVLDGFCGAGGNTIQFANHCHKVYAVDIDQIKVDLTKHNCYVYGIPNEKVTVMKDDYHFFCSLYDNGNQSHATVDLPKIDVVYLSPPWGGQDYIKSDKNSSTEFDLSSISMTKLLDSARLLRPRLIIVYLPRHTNTDQLQQFCKNNETVSITKHSSNYKKNDSGKIKAVTAVFTLNQ